MTLLHSMGLAGSVATLLYMLSHPLTKRYLSILWHKFYLTLNIALFLMPFGYFKSGYIKFLNECFGVGQWFHDENMADNLSNQVILVFEDGIYAHNWLMYIFFFSCLTVSVILASVYLKKYVSLCGKIKRNLRCYGYGNRRLSVITRNKSFKCKVYICENASSPFTVGIFRRKIVLPDVEWKNSQLDAVLCHEFAHVCARDNLIKFILCIVTIMNFYNPLVYYLFYRWSLISEIYCDSRALKGKDLKEKNDYANLIIDFAQTQSSGKAMFEGFSLSKIKWKERICSMKNIDKSYGKISKAVGTLILLTAVIASSMTVYAYEPRQIMYFDEERNGAAAEIYFFDEGINPALSSEDEMFFLYNEYFGTDTEEIFVGNDGTVYYDLHTNTENEANSSCSHTYATGIYGNHLLSSSGGCTTNYYNGKRCSKCGYTVLETYISSISYEVCPH